MVASSELVNTCQSIHSLDYRNSQINRIQLASMIYNRSLHVNHCLDLQNGGSTNHSSALQFQDEPMETSMSRSSAKQQAIEDLRKELRSHAEDKPKPYKEDIPKTPIKDVPTENKCKVHLII